MDPLPQEPLTYTIAQNPSIDLPIFQQNGKKRPFKGKHPSAGLMFCLRFADPPSFENGLSLSAALAESAEISDIPVKGADLFRNLTGSSVDVLPESEPLIRMLGELSLQGRIRSCPVSFPHLLRGA